MTTTFEQIAIFLAGLHHIKSDDPALQARMHSLLQLATLAVWISTLFPGISRIWRRDFRGDVLLSVVANLIGFLISAAAFITAKEDIAFEVTQAVAACSLRYIHQTLVKPPPAKPLLPISASVPVTPCSSSNSNPMNDLLQQAIESALKLAAPGAVIEPSSVPFIKFGDYVYNTTVYNLSSYQPATPSVPPLDSETTSTTPLVPPLDSETTSTSSPTLGFMYKLISVIATRA